MSAPAPSTLEQRVTALETALGLPSAASAAPADAELAAKLAAAEKALARANYRIVHLTRAYDELRARAEKAEAASSK